jgi:hypothetical protein
MLWGEIKRTGLEPAGTRANIRTSKGRTGLGGAVCPTQGRKLLNYFVLEFVQGFRAGHNPVGAAERDTGGRGRSPWRGHTKPL